MNILSTANACFKKYRKPRMRGRFRKGDRKSMDVILQEPFIGYILQNGIWEIETPPVLTGQGGQNPKDTDALDELLLGYVDLNQATIEFTLSQKNDILHICGTIIIQGREAGYIDSNIAGPSRESGPMAISSSLLEYYRKSVAAEVAHWCSMNISFAHEVSALAGILYDCNH